MKTLLIKITTSEAALRESATYLGWDGTGTAEDFIILHAKRQIAYNLTEAQRVSAQKRMAESVMQLQAACDLEIKSVIDFVTQNTIVEVV